MRSEYCSERFRNARRLQHVEGGKLIEINFCLPIREFRLLKHKERHSCKAASTLVEMCRYTAQSHQA